MIKDLASQRERYRELKTLQPEKEHVSPRASTVYSEDDPNIFPQDKEFKSVSTLIHL